MGGLLKGLVRIIVLGSIAAWVGGVIGALAVKRRTVVRDDPADDEVVLVAIFGPLEFASSARHFRGGTVETWFGGGLIDLRDAVLDPRGADLTLRAVFGGGQIIVPDGWRVTIAMRGLGGVTDGRPTDEEAPDGPELRISAMVLAGGYAVTSSGPDLDMDEGDVPWRAVPIEVS
jgi:hypothetical protein